MYGGMEVGSLYGREWWCFTSFCFVFGETAYSINWKEWIGLRVSLHMTVKKSPFACHELDVSCSVCSIGAVQLNCPSDI